MSNAWREIPDFNLVAPGDWVLSAVQNRVPVRNLRVEAIRTWQNNQVFLSCPDPTACEKRVLTISENLVVF